MTIKDKFPSIKPTLNLDFANTKAVDPRITFTRNDIQPTATYYDGKTYAKAEENLLTYSQDFTQGAWSKFAGYVVANASIAPDGNPTAAVFSATGATGSVRQPYTYLTNVDYTFSIWLRRRTGTGNVRISANYNQTAGLPVSIDSTWKRFTNTLTNTQSVGAPWVQCDTSGDEIEVWGAQLEQRSSATAYTPTTSASITNYISALQTAAVGAPRIDHDLLTGECKGLLIEEQRANLLTGSQQFNFQYSQNVALTTNVTIAPDGTLTASSLVASTALSTHLADYYTAYGSTGAFSLSVYAKTKGGHKLQLALYSIGSIGGVATFNLVDGTVSLSSGTSATITPVGNGWYRCVLTHTLTATTSPLQRFSVLSATGESSFAGDGYSGVYIWGAQLEAGAFPTSYIKTEASQVTRSADSASMTGSNFSSWYRQDEGSYFLEWVSSNLGTEYRSLLTVGSDTSNRVRIGNGNGFNYYNTAFTSVTTGGTTQNEVWPAISPSVGAYKKTASAMAANSFATSTNGSPVSTNAISSSGRLPFASRMDIGSDITGVSPSTCYIKRIAYYPKRLTDSQLQQLTQ